MSEGNSPDNALELLLPAVGDHRGAGLWLVDENLSANALPPLPPALKLIGNRIDLCDTLRGRGFDIECSDFDFSALDDACLDVVYYRVSKEKPIVHHIINQAGRCLKPGGRLLLAGCKNEGVKTYVAKAGKALGEAVDKRRGSGGALLATIERDDCVAEPLDDRDYREFRLINPGDEVEFVSKPGQFGWEKCDRGSAFLIEQLPAFLQTMNVAPKTVADLGCGYGYLSVSASRLLDAEFFAADNNVAAVESCRQNFARHGLRGSVVMDDCGQSIAGPVDLVLCNPPFHQGFDVDGDLTRHFLQSAARLLPAGGRALFVVNAFIGLEKKSAGLFRRCETVDNNGSFKLIALEK